jgi:predicted RecA/RadA family phage recombinase
MKFSALLLATVQSLLAQQELTKQYWPNEIMDNREKEVVSLLDYKDNLYHGAQINACFKIPKEKFDNIVVGEKHILKVFTSDKCEGNALYDIQGTFGVNGNSENWLSGKVISLDNSNPTSSGRRHLRAEQQDLTKEYWPNEIMENREKEVVSLLDYYDNLYYGAQVNTCFKLPKKEIDTIVVGGKNILKVFSSDDCSNGEVTEIKGTYSVDGNNDNWLSGKVVEPHNSNSASSGRRHLKAAGRHHRSRHGGKYQNYRV